MSEPLSIAKKGEWGIISPAVYKVTIQATPAEKIDWRVVASGIWTPGQQPELDHTDLSPEVLEQLFNITPSETDQSGRNQIQSGETIYGVVFRRLSRLDRHRI